MMSQVLLFVAWFFFAGVVAQTTAVARTDPCYITPDVLKSSIRQANMQRAMCEGSNFKSAYCSNYWAAIDEVRLLSGKFQRCRENKNAAYRFWVYGANNNALPGAFAYQGVLDRIYVSNNATSLETLVNITFQHTTNLTESLYLADLASILATHTSQNQLTVSLEDLSQAATRTLVEQEEQLSRADVDMQHAALRALITGQEISTMNFVTFNALAEQALVSLMYGMARTNQSLESQHTRAEDLAQTATTQDLDSAEESKTRQDEDLQSLQTRTYHDTVLGITQAIVTSEVVTQTAQTQSNTFSEAQTTRSAVLASNQQTQANDTATETATAAFSAAQSTLNRLATQSAVQAANLVVVQTVNTQEPITGNAISSDLLQLVTDVNSTESTTRADVAADEVNFQSDVHISESATRSLFTNVALPAMLSATSQAQSILGAENGTLTTILLHMYLANSGSCFFNTFGIIDLFARPELPYLLQIQGIVNNTVSYNSARYSIGSAQSTLALGNSKLAIGDYDDALAFWRQAYASATRSS